MGSKVGSPGLAAALPAFDPILAARLQARWFNVTAVAAPLMAGLLPLGP
jgi:hypothetical protein